MTDEKKQKYEQRQLTEWQGAVEEIKSFFLRFGVEIDCQGLGLFDLDYEDIQPAAYLIAKLRKIISICDFLDSRAKEHNEDVDKIKIFHLISHAEIVMNVLCDATRNNAEKVDDFFVPVDSQLQHSLCLTISDNSQLTSQGQVTSSSRILYKLRCEYAHQGNFTGKVFRRDSAEDHVYNYFAFYWDLPGSRTKVFASAETNLTYYDFLNIYFTAFKNHLAKYISKRKP